MPLTTKEMIEWFQDHDAGISTNMKYLVGAGLMLGATSSAVSFILNWRERQALRAKGKAYREKIQQQLEDLKQRLKHGKVSKEDRERITSLSTADLVDQLQKGQLKPSEVLEAYQAKALEVHEKTNCIVGLVDNAEEMAKELDSSAEKGPLYGLPIGLKEFHFIKGHPYSFGFVKCLDIPVEEDCVFIQVLKKQGAVPFVRTNFPQAGMSYECANPIFGETFNPLDLTRSPGGSSGGCGALVAGGGALASFGSDIGGSVRAPAASCGIYSLRPTQGRLSEKGVLTMEGQNVINVVSGPLCRDLDCLVLTMKAQLVPLMHELDPSQPPLQFNNEVYESKRGLRIGYFSQDGQVRAVPACERAVMQAKAILERRGHTLVAWSPPRQHDLLRTVFRIYYGDADGKTGKDLMRNEEHNRCLLSAQRYWYYPEWLRKIVVAYTRRTDPSLANVIEGMKGTRTTEDWWKLVAYVSAYRREFLGNWSENQLDAVICPPGAYPAVKLGTCWETWLRGSYLVMYNLVNMPAGILPVTKVTQDDVSTLNDIQDPLLDFAKKDAVGSEGLPVAVQVAAAPFEEEMVLRVMKEIELGR